MFRKRTKENFGSHVYITYALIGFFIYFFWIAATQLAGWEHKGFFQGLIHDLIPLYACIFIASWNYAKSEINRFHEIKFIVMVGFGLFGIIFSYAVF
jgi:hypothetical protein